MPEQVTGILTKNILSVHRYGCKNLQNKKQLKIIPLY